MAWIEHTQSGLRYVDRVKIGGKYKKVSTPIERDTAQARRSAQERLLERIKAIEQPISEMTVNGAITAYMDRQIRESTRITQINGLKVLSGIYDTPISTVTAPMLRRTLRECGKPIKTVNDRLPYIKGLFKWAYEYGYIPEDIASKIRKFPEHQRKKYPSELYLEAAELRDLLDHLHGMAYHATYFLALTGLRIGEMTALEVSDVDQDHIHITKSYSHISRDITEPKNQSSIRDVFIQPELRTFLDEYLRWRKLYMMAKGIRTNLLFFSHHGNYYTESSLGYALREVDPKYHAHLLRHTHVALLAEQGISLEAIARRLGHTDSKTTRAVYYHVTEKQKQKDEAALSVVKIL